MLVEVRVPILAESVADATLMTWHKKVGDRVKRGENLVDLETDKVVLEVPAPEDGVLKEIVKQSGETALSDELLAIIDTDLETPRAETESPKEEPASSPEEPKLGPAVRKLLADKELSPTELTEIPATGKGGRLTKGDVLAYLETSAGEQPTEKPLIEQPIDKPSVELEVIEPPESAPSATVARPEQRVAMSRLRRRAAERLLAAQQQNAILTTFNEVNMQPVIDLRHRYREDFEKQYKVKLGFMSFFVKAAIEALKRFPIVNASVDGNDIVYHGYYDLGIAVSSPRGLVVPILRNADRLSFAEIEAKIQEFSDKARESRLTVEELTGGTFTITNGGVFGSLLSTPIINPPQSAILGMHRIQDRPVAENGVVVVRPMMYLALSYDHRIIDGREAVQFLVTIKTQLEDPARMLLQI